MFSGCADAREEGEPATKQRVRDMRAASTTLNSLIPALGNPGHLTGQQLERRGNVAKEPRNTRTLGGKLTQCRDPGEPGISIPGYLRKEGMD